MTILNKNIISHSLFSFIEQSRLEELINESAVFDVKENKFFESHYSQDSLIICIEGLTSLIDRKSDRQTEKAIPGRSLELRSLFLERETSQYRWLAKVDSKFISISFKKFISIATPEQVEYLKRISIRSELQNIKNSLRLFHVSDLLIQQLISSLQEVDFNSLGNDSGICIPNQKEIKISYNKEHSEKAREIYTCQPGNLFIKYDIPEIKYTTGPNNCWFISKADSDQISEEIFSSVEILDETKDKIEEFKSVELEKIEEDQTETEPELDDGIEIDSFYKELVFKEIGNFKKKILHERVLLCSPLKEGASN